MQKYALNRKWFYLYGAIIFFAYLYIRPLIRRRLGSASEGYINYYSVYLFWLGSAVFVHLPSFQSMGIDVKADISMLLTVFLLSLLILGALHAIHAVAVFFKLMSPALYSPGAGRKGMYTLVILNSLNLAVACSTYYSFCGNAGLKQKDGSAGEFRAAMCNKWLHPVAIRDHPAFASWVLYGEGAGLGTTQTKGPQILNIDIPFDGLGLISIPASETISPVFTMWITLVAMYTVHCWADYQAAVDMRARSASSLRRQIAASARSSRQQRRYSAGSNAAPNTDAAMQRAATLFEPLELQLRRYSIGSLAESLGGGFLSNVSKNLDSLLSSSLSMSLDEPAGSQSSGGTRKHSQQRGKAQRLNYQGVQEEEHDADNVGKTGDQRTQAGEDGEEQPEFLPMFPWYSGTSADMYRTVFELLVSVKLFLGRFDMRTMQAATAITPPGTASDPPRAGDGFTFEHLADRPQLWLDFCADTGDGGNPTYAVARAMAAPGLKVAVPAELDLPVSSSRPGSAGLRGKSAPASFGSDPKLNGAGAGEPWQRGRPHAVKLLSPAKAVRGSPGPRAASPSSDTSSGLGTSLGSEGEDSSSDAEQPPTRRVTFRESRLDHSPLSNKSQRPKRMESPFDAAAQVAHPGGQGSLHPGSSPASPGGLDRAARLVKLPRADVMVIGGDLAYPNPSNETYEQRFFRPFEAALPPPPHVRPGRLVVYKPDLPGAADVLHTSPGEQQARNVHGSQYNASRAAASAELLHQYEGPTAFAIPGNHDWIDGLETYTRHIQHKGWLGGWLLPQEKSYFALALPHGWWLFGLDLALVDDIDMCQCRYFARIADERMGPGDQAILVTHQPRWLSDWFWDETACHNLRQLVRGHLRGRARVHLAGDLHFYMRHSFCPFHAAAPPAPSPAPSPAAANEAGMQNDDQGTSQALGVDSQTGTTSSSRSSSHATASMAEPSESKTKKGAAAARFGQAGNGLSHTCFNRGPSVRAVPAELSNKGAKHAQRGGGPASTALHLRALSRQDPSMAEPAPGSYASSTTSGTSADDLNELRRRSQSGGGASTSGQSTSSGWHPHDPEHLIVNGLGGAFLHPTHVFSPSRFVSVPDPSADEATVTSTRPTANILPRGRSPPRGSSPRGSSPSRGPSPRGSSPVARFIRASTSGVADAVAAVKAEDNEEAELWGGGEYHCMAAYPSPSCSMQLGRQNLHLFRLKNTRFDVIGGIFYFCLVVSVLPRCNSVSAVLDAHSLSQGLQLLMEAVTDALGIIFTESYISLGALLGMFLMTFGFASAGGVGASAAPPGSTVAKFAKDEDSIRSRLALRARTGGALTKCVFAFVHTAVHLLVALMLMVLLELGVETCIRYESVGKEGYHSLYKWYQGFEAEHFPDPKGLRDTVARWTLHIYPNCIQAAMALFDVPEAIAVSRTKICTAGGVLHLTRLQAGAYYMGMLAYYWVLATPAVGFLFGCYLYIAVNCFHVHYDEAFSALRIPNFKGFSRLHINTDGDLEIYGLAMDKGHLAMHCVQVDDCGSARCKTESVRHSSV
ncbi:hypothetical protein ABBQ32_002515 [Trebouxia sp. C0010 RCD-2024]